MGSFKFKIGAAAAAPTERHPVEVMTDSVNLVDFVRNGELVPAFAFATADGRGTSPEVVPLDEIEEYAAVLRKALDEGIPERAEDDEGYIPSYVVLAAELHQGEYTTIRKDASGEPVKLNGKVQRDDHGVRYFFRSNTGRGAKTQKIRPEHFEDVVGFVEALIDEVPGTLDMWNRELPNIMKARAEAEAKAQTEAAKAANA